MKVTQIYNESPIESPLKEFWRAYRRNQAATISLFILLVILLLVIFGPLFSPYDPTQQFSDSLLSPPAWQEGSNSHFLLGTDDLGRDILSRIIMGGRLTLGLASSVVSIALIAGLFLGALAATSNHWIEAILMRIMDIMLALPSLLLAIVIVAILGPGLPNAVYAVAVVLIPHFTRITRAAIQEEMNKDYVTAAKLDGAGWFRLMTHTILPNIAAPLIVQTTIGLSTAILDIAALGFLHLGAQPPAAEWGTILSESRDFIQLAPWTVTIPGLAILITVLCVNLVGDGLRDALDPKLAYTRDQ